MGFVWVCAGFDVVGHHTMDTERAGVGEVFRSVLMHYLCKLT